MYNVKFMNPEFNILKSADKYCLKFSQFEFGFYLWLKIKFMTHT